MGMLRDLGLKLDTWHGRTAMARFKNGWPAHASPDVGFYRTPLTQYRYRVVGSGPTLVFAADPPMSLENYDGLIEAFSPYFRVIVFELPAMGFSAVSSDYRFDFYQTNDDVARFLADVAGEGAILAFSCVAGLCAVDLACRRPELVSRLALIQTTDVAGFAVWKARRDPQGILAKPIIGQLAMKQMAPKRMPAWYRLSVGRKEMIDALVACACRSFEHGAMWSLASAYQVYMDPSIRLGRPKQPALAFWGQADRSHPAEHVDSPKRLADHVDMIVYPDLGHTPELEDPARLCTDLRAWIAKSGQVFPPAPEAPII